MSDYTRYAVYYLPPEGSALARFGASWLGWDSTTAQEAAHPNVRSVDVAAITATPRKYGFHGTMKPPFRLAEGTRTDDLKTELATLAAQHLAFEAPPLALKSLGYFLALVPSAPCEPLADLAARCVMDLDHFRAPPGEAELAKRRAAGLSAPQEANLLKWGYPYVFDQFRFHLTLSGKLEDAELAATKSELEPLTAPLCQGPMPVVDIALLGEVDGGRFHVIHRYPLTG